jgi:hypothetical protein
MHGVLPFERNELGKYNNNCYGAVNINKKIKNQSCRSIIKNKVTDMCIQKVRELVYMYGDDRIQLVTALFGNV